MCLPDSRGIDLAMKVNDYFGIIVSIGNKLGALERWLNIVTKMQATPRVRHFSEKLDNFLSPIFYSDRNRYKRSDKFNTEEGVKFFIPVGRYAIVVITMNLDIS